jgi:hypothetical protein
MPQRKCDWNGCSEIGLFDGLDKKLLTEQGNHAGSASDGDHQCVPFFQTCDFTTPALVEISQSDKLSDGTVPLFHPVKFAR